MYFYEWALSQELHYSWRMEFIMMSLGKWTKAKVRLLLGSSGKKSVYCNTHHFWMNFWKKVSFGWTQTHGALACWAITGMHFSTIISSADPTCAVHSLYNCAQQSWGVSRELPEMRCNENFVSLFTGLKSTVFRPNPFPRPFPLFPLVGAMTAYPLSIDP